jgi:DNA-binding transcriptional regulator YiaG
MSLILKVPTTIENGLRLAATRAGVSLDALALDALRERAAQSVNNPVKDVRKALDLTQREMADKLQCSFTTARRCEYEARLPQTAAVVSNLKKLAKQAGVSIESEVTP